jgi:succinoglycan biosynthesis protein ExoO
MSQGLVVSVVIPAFNAARFIGVAIESCRRQTMPDFEVLVVDDGSVDDTVAVVQGLAATDPRVVLIELGTNRGVSAARNAALERAQGTWIATLDADDWMTDDRLEVLVGAAEAAGVDLAHDDELLVHEGETEAYSTLSASTRSSVAAITTVDLDRLIDCEAGGNSDYRLGLTQPIIRRAFLDAHAIRYDERLRVGEDHLLYLECLLAGATWIQIPTAHYIYVQRAGSATSTGQIPTLESKLAVCESILARSSLTPSQRTSVRRYRRNLATLLAYRRVVEPARARRFAAAAAAAIRNPSFVRRVARETPALVKRRWAYHVRRDRHALDMLR